LPRRPSPTADPADLVTDQAGAEHRLAHQLVRAGLDVDVVLDAEAPQD